ncbi:hypothetical protein CORMATOL_02328 [Corynebacterium matruchotii ATCC 33806]|uniref:Uncharacterized protein n=1 Tax=Corynebacterium matruchotii ATCC 33806 TaxID=566549 RepID=C0E5P6_9CORY|nr:hypothetical protein CORMATOL_02328 [Corynebacterium matruchotii ATCC 33806]
MMGATIRGRILWNFGVSVRPGIGWAISVSSTCHNAVRIVAW